MQTEGTLLAFSPWREPRIWLGEGGRTNGDNGDRRAPVSELEAVGSGCTPAGSWKVFLRVAGQPIQGLHLLISQVGTELLLPMLTDSSLDSRSTQGS